MVLGAQETLPAEGEAGHSCPRSASAILRQEERLASFTEESNSPGHLG